GGVSYVVPNATPVASAQSVTVAQDGSIAITLVATDGDSDPVTYTVGTPANGSLTGSAPSLTYTPTASYNGADSFTFYATDGTDTSNTATVSITVNGTPVPTAQDFTMLTNSITDAALAAEDPEGDAITYNVISTPVSGVLTGVAPDLTYTPDTDFTGAVSFTFTASDAYSTSAVTSVDITVVDPVVLSGVDLMVNGGFETGDATGWTVVDDSWPGNTGEGGVSPIEGSYFIDAGTATAELMQVVDVSGYESQITAGTMTIGLSAYARSKSEAKPDSARVILEHRAANNSTILYSSDTGWFKNTGSWKQVTDVTAPPVGTEYIAVRLLASRSGSNMDAFFDDVELFAEGDAEVAVFDGVDDYIAVPDSASLTVTNEVTLEAWVYPTGPGSHETYGGVILSKEGEYQLGRDPTGDLWGVLAIDSPAWTVAYSGVTIPEGEWSHVAMTYEAVFGAIEFYVNGVNVASAVGSGSIGDVDESDDALYIGGRSDGTEIFDGQIDEPRVWSIERPAAHIGNVYQKKHSGGETGLAGYWPLDGASLLDATGFANDGVASGAGASIGFPLGFVANAAPTFSSIATQAADAGVAVVIPLSVSDTDGDSLTVDVVTPPSGATVTIDDVAATATYLPLLGTAGTQTFTLAANDGVALSGVVTVAVDVTAADFDPVVGGLLELVNDDFQAGVTGPWTNTTTTTAPADGSRGFLGQFGNGTVSLPLSGIPAHSEVTLSFDLYLLNSWDGSGGAGPDLITVTADETTLLSSTFSNVTNGSDNGFQSYPAPYNSALYAARTGATEAGTLGGTFYGDSVYEFTYTFGHSDSTLQFNFSASGLESVSNESWGLDNVVVTTQHLHLEEDFVTVVTLPGSDAGGEALTFTVVTPPSNGSISVSGNEATYTPTQYYSGTDSFGYTVSDATTTTPESTVAILIDALDSAPVFDTIGDVTLDEDSAEQTITITNVGPGGNGDEDAQTVSLTATSFSTARISSPTITGTGDTRTLTFTPVPDAAGSVTLVATATDTGSNVPSGGPSDSAHINTKSQQFAITVTALNDAPEFDAIADVTMDEDAAPAPITITGVGTGGGADEASQTVTFTATSDREDIVPVPTFSGSGDTRTLTFAPVAEANGSAIITVTATDDGGNVPDTEFDTLSRTFTITVDAVNDSPAFDEVATQVFGEDAGPLEVPITGVTTGGGTDETGAQTVTFVATSSLPTLIPDPTFTGSGATRTISLDSVTDESGSATITVTATDDGGVVGGLDVDAFTQSFTVLVTAVNDAPLFDDVLAVSVEEDAGSSTVDITGVGPGGGADEASQGLLFTATSSDTSIVPNPSVGISGDTATATFTPTTDANGTATITLTLTDSGSSTGSHVNTQTKTFDITVDAVNDAPVFDIPDPVTVDEDSGAASVAITNVAVGGGADESSSQVATLTATSSTPSIIPDPTVSGSGPTWALTYAPVADEAGVVTITVVVDDGGPTEGVSDVATTTQTFDITVAGINDAPTLSAISDITIDEDAGLTLVSLGSVGPGGGSDEASQTVSFSTASFKTSVIPSLSVSAAEGGYDLSFTPVADANGVVTMVVSALDDGSSVSPNLNQTQHA
ncbi:tandem-95 repeat protein, partial [Candidatus Poribacteria bacterium]|nr:tandem-95 repeat protein [Candidatus Poribacteria bacterium]